uniref:Putative terminase n=1 Tax=viral metagenome TaxID=1070528 RepID=A0A6H1ZGV5_9ZZZZ
MEEAVNKETIKRYRADFKEYAEKCLIIRDHNTAKLVPFKFRFPQQVLHEVAEKQRAETGRVRIMNLKARRYGGSTYVEGRFYWKTSLNSNRNAFIIGHEEESTNTLFKMAKLFHEQNKFAERKPPTLTTNAKELIFDKPDGTGLKSEYRLATARNVHAGKSQGIHYLHDSEEAQWEGNPEELLTSLFACVPKDRETDTEIFRESTAQGFGNTFQEDVFAAYAEGRYPYYQKDGITYAWSNPLSEWILVFIPWFSIEIYTMPFESEDKKESFSKKINEKVFDPIELQWVESEASKLRRKFNLTIEQLYWRDWTIENDCRGSVDKFHQNYPSTVEEAFLSTGTNVYPKELCDNLEENCQGPLAVGDLMKSAGQTRIKRNKHGKFRIWEKPDPKGQYFMCIDSGGGKNERQKKEKKDPDPSCVDVWNHRTGHQAAQWHGHIEYDMIADIAEMIGDMFGRKNCPACVEMMNHGFTVIADLKRKKYPMYERLPDEPGWSTNAKTKPLMVDDLYRMARDGQIYIKSKQTVSEMRTFIEENGRYNAASGCHDERVDTAGMASQMFQLMPLRIADSETSKDFYGFNNITARYKTERDGYKEYYARV